MISEIISEEVKKQTDLLNAKAVIKAIHNQFNVCEVCNYPKNKQIFSLLLKRYEQYRILIQREKRKSNRFFVWNSSIRDNAIACRDEMDAIYPCQTCIETYNPTNKKKYRTSVLNNNLITKWLEGE